MADFLKIIGTLLVLYSLYSLWGWHGIILASGLFILGEGENIRRQNSIKVAKMFQEMKKDFPELNE